MNRSIEEAQSILLDLKSELQKFRDFWIIAQKDKLDFEQLSDAQWGVKSSRCWLHGSTDLQESNELERWLFDRPLLNGMAKEKTSKCIKCWKVWSQLKNRYYSDFPEYSKGMIVHLEKTSL
ncbi:MULTISPECIES: hypothetical protein [unclassified Neochlamydia]|uniref:hypothetical protein n=1 Tax=unclassified Neochlamydia TaxID=2643326 RepID=UPI00140B265B|nr:MULTISPECIES: hypothetical protein [unclassified Neochlamydia]